jgi:tetratricopeptide (TPR) repeat protein
MRASLVPFAGAAEVTRTVPESADARERLRSLGYASGKRTALTAPFTATDDPKRLIASDAALQATIGRYLAGDRAGALEAARDFARAHPSNALGQLNLAQLERETGHLPEAIAAMRRAVALAPTNVASTALLGSYLTEDGHPDAAVDLLRPLASQPDPDLDVLVALGLAQARQGAFDASLATFARARGQAPHNAMLLVSAGTVSMMAGRNDAARESFAAAIEESPSLARAHSSLGVIEAEAGRTEAAIAEWRTATKLDSSEFGRLFVLGASLAQRGDAVKARPFLTFVAESAPPGPQQAQARAWLDRQP